MNKYYLTSRIKMPWLIDKPKLKPRPIDENIVMENLWDGLEKELIKLKLI